MMFMIKNTFSGLPLSTLNRFPRLKPQKHPSQTYSVLFHHVIHSPCLTIPRLISHHLTLLPPAHQPVLHTVLKIICQLSNLALCHQLTLSAQTLPLTLQTQGTHHTLLIPIRLFTLMAPTPSLTLMAPPPLLTLQ